MKHDRNVLSHFLRKSGRLKNVAHDDHKFQHKLTTSLKNPLFLPNFDLSFQRYGQFSIRTTV